MSKPWGDSSPYDVTVEAAGTFLRVQVKSTDYKGRTGYACNFKAAMALCPIGQINWTSLPPM